MKMLKRLYIQRDKIILITFFLVNLLMAHVLLPNYLNKRNLLLFSDWNLFSFYMHKTIMDVSWGNGMYFLKRDKMKSVRGYGLNTISLNYRINHRELTPKDVEIIAIICKCNDFKLVRLKGQLYEHILFKKKLPLDEEYEII